MAEMNPSVIFNANMGKHALLLLIWQKEIPTKIIQQMFEKPLENEAMFNFSVPSCNAITAPKLTVFLVLISSW